MTMELMNINTAAIVPVVVAIVQVIKMITPENSQKWSPIISLGVGLLLSAILNNDTMEWDQLIMAGFLYGLSASGLYSGTKSTAHAVKGEPNE